MRVLFLDRDGVINQNRPDHVKSCDEFVFLPGVLEAFRLLYQERWMTIVITNQAIVHRGIVSQVQVDEINRYMVQKVEEQGGRIHAVLCCPHRPEENCDCRKPRPGLLLEAARQFNLSLDACTLIGDAWSDIAAGRAVGSECILVRTGRGLQQLVRPEALYYTPCEISRDLLSAVRQLIQREKVQHRQVLSAAWTASLPLYYTATVGRRTGGTTLRSEPESS